MSDTFEDKIAKAMVLDMFDDDGNKETVDWLGTTQVAGQTIAILKYSDDKIGFARYGLDDDAIESFQPLPDDDITLFFKCCAAYEALLSE